MKLSDHFSPGALFVMAITFVLFGLALVTKGFTHDLLLEAAVFLVSVKLMLMAHRNSIQTHEPWMPSWISSTKPSGLPRSRRGRWGAAPR